ncbi:hypothetical protein FD31_GL000409 [Companilactobacillus nantensis DSM 16982]|uniref:Uncharacterized protein n=1 Tax=Companilactobacillus nantensis DSM 16982 TaxID=1423774 RepID=A0A0R1WRX7_9LACO|nr:hypothetical protein FD31_GL000409 [Companilactobacillus nantensis DSM 16982]
MKITPPLMVTIVITIDNQIVIIAITYIQSIMMFILRIKATDRPFENYPPTD